MSKLGPHCLTSTDTAKRMIDAGCKIAKFVGDFGLAEYAISKGVTVIGRVYTPVTAESLRYMDPQDAAQHFIDIQKEQYRLNPTIEIWEGPNEPVWGMADSVESRENMRWYSDFEIARLSILSWMGLRGVIGNFSTGNPDMPLWSYFLPAVAWAKRMNGILGLHEYSSPWMWWMTGKYQIDPNADAGNLGWTTLRYRRVMKDYLQISGVDDVKIVINECGLDRVGPVLPGHPSGNWRTNAQWWPSWDGSIDPIPYWWRGDERDPERYYAEQLIWYDRELMKDPNVVGATIFTVGHIDPAWADYDINGTRVANFLVDHISATANEPDPIPEPEPEPEPEPPMSKLSFESKNWITIPAGVYGTGNQIPEGWELWLAPQDELMPIPTKMQEGSTVPAIAGGPAECVHKGANINPDGSANLPPDELLGQPRALVLDGERCYKIFGGIPNAVILKTVLAGTPGSLLLVTVPVLGETQNQPTPPNTKLEDDHFIARVGMGTDVDVANYAMMIVERGIENNQRPWYVFVVSSIVPSSGELDLEILLQTNWAGGTDWFIDDINVREELEEEDGDDNDNDGDDIDDVLPDAAKPWATIINIAFEEVQKVVGLSDFQRGYIEAIQSLWERL